MPLRNHHLPFAGAEWVARLNRRPRRETPIGYVPHLNRKRDAVHDARGQRAGPATFFDYDCVQFKLHFCASFDFQDAFRPAEHSGDLDYFFGFCRQARHQVLHFGATMCDNLDPDLIRGKVAG